MKIIDFSGEKLVPLSDCQMGSRTANIAEPRKVAKIQSDLTDELTQLV